jgi:hypothetical protein
MNRPNSSLRPLAALVLLSVWALPSRAAGHVNIAWDDCASFGSESRAFACDTNIGANQIFASFEPPTTMHQLDGLVVSMIVTTSNSSTLSPWWHWEGGGCRDGSLVAAFNYLAGPYNCTDTWQGLAAGGVQFFASYYGVNRSRIDGVCAVAVGVEVDPGTEYYGITIRFNDAKTVGAGSCSGCLEGACFQVVSATLYQPVGVGDYTVGPGPQSMAIWNGGPLTDCIVIEPTRTRSWGQIKGLYR